ncbi:erg24, C-14 sterol reductase [Hanseniaspora valbyensis]
MSKQKTVVLNPRTEQVEFSGVPGAFAISFGLPILIIVLNQMIRPDYYITGFFKNFSFEEVFHRGDLRSFKDYLFNIKDTWFYYIVWFFALAILDIVLPGKTMNGVKLRDGTFLKYKINGIALSSLLIIVLAYRFKLTDGQMPELQYLYKHHLDVCVVSILFAFFLAVIVYVMSFIPLTFTKNGLGNRERILALGGNSKSVIYDWFIGRELNPRIGLLDIKLFCELRPGMLLWLLINLAALHKVWLETGKINNALVLINLLQGFYIFDGVLNEEGCLTMMDITTDGFGFMLAFGDLSLVPFTYCLQARYLSCNVIELANWQLGLITATMCIGYYIFHSANQQKSDFRQGKLPHLKSIQTKRSTKLLCDGWWAKSQHINYLGDWLISLSWCLTTWNCTPLTYYYSLYFATLLLHRQTRDEHKCREKYGESWREYEKQVPYKIIPYIY